MVVNIFIIKKYIVLVLMPMLIVILFYIGLINYGFLWSLAFLGAGLLINTIISAMLIKNPFTQMVEGKGILAINMDSTGILTPFILAVNPPFLKGKIFNKNINDVFDRSTVLQIAQPIQNKTPAKPNEEGGIDIKLDREKYNLGRFALFHYPVIIWNEQINSILTKDFFAEKEKDAFSEHGVLYLNRKMEELTSAVRNFGRYVVELTKPDKFKMTPIKWVILAIIIAGGIVLFMFAPSIIKVIKGGVDSAGGISGIFQPIN